MAHFIEGISSFRVTTDHPDKSGLYVPRHISKDRWVYTGDHFRVEYSNGFHLLWNGDPSPLPTAQGTDTINQLQFVRGLLGGGGDKRQPKYPRTTKPVVKVNASNMVLSGVGATTWFSGLRDSGTSLSFTTDLIIDTGSKETVDAWITKSAMSGFTVIVDDASIEDRPMLECVDSGGYVVHQSSRLDPIDKIVEMFATSTTAATTTVDTIRTGGVSSVVSLVRYVLHHVAQVLPRVI